MWCGLWLDAVCGVNFERFLRDLRRGLVISCLVVSVELCGGAL